MMTKEVVQIGLVGCGGIAQEHLKSWCKLGGVSLIAVCDSNESRARETAETWHIPAFYRDLGEMLAKEPISIVDVCTPPQIHCHLVIKALESGCHVIVEKPLTMTTEEAKKLISAQRSSKGKVSIIRNWLFAPAMIKGLALIEKGNIGKTISASICVLSTPNNHVTSNKEHWAHTSPGGRFGDILAHPIYILQAILGELKMMSVQATKIGNYPWVRFDELWVSLKAGTGFGSIYVSLNSIRDEVFLNIYGTEGVLKINPFAHTVIQLKSMAPTKMGRGIDNLQHAYQYLAAIARGAVGIVSGKWGGGHEACLKGCLANIMDDKEPLAELEEAYANVEILEQICSQIDSATWNKTFNGKSEL